MSTVTLHRRSIPVERCGSRLSFFVVAFLLLAALPAGAAQAQDYARDIGETAKSWGMQMLGVIQAATGDVQQANQTLTQITANSNKSRSPVTVASFENSQSRSNQPRATIGNEIGDLKNMHCSYRDRIANYVPAEVPAGLPSNYLAADPRHGRLVDFTDESDSRGTRVTSRTYADGHVVIETPHADASASQIIGSSQPNSLVPEDRS